jgi:hypothetical protein
VLTVFAALLVALPLGCGGGGSNGGKGGGGGGAGTASAGTMGGNAATGRGGAAGTATGVGGGGRGGAGGAGAAGTAGGGGAAGTGGAGAAGTAGGGGAAGTGGAAGAAAGAAGTAGTGGAAAGTGGGTAGSAGSAGTTGGAQGAGGAGGRGGANGGGGGAGTGGAPAPLWDWVGVIGTGQSLAVGGHGNAPAMPIGATTQRFHNLKLSLGNANVPPFDPANAMLSLVPLVETIRPIATGYPSPYPRNIYGESFHTAMADELSTFVMASQSRDYITVHTVVGEAGQAIAVLQKGAQDTGSTGRAYAASVFEVAAIARLAKAQGKSYGVGAIVLTHGESDAASATFEADMVKLWQSYNQDLPGLTGQAAGTPIPMLLSQQHSEPTGAGSSSTGTLAQWRIGLDHPGDITCTGPKYQYAYVSDNIHLTNAEYERLGEKYAEVMVRRVVLGEAWQPLQPTSVERSAARVITVHFHVPSSPLAWDTTLPMPHQTAFTEWAQGRGFEVRNGTTRLAISGVAIAGDTVQITTVADLPTTGVVVGYASSADGTIRPNGTVRWGQLHDTDSFVGSLTRAVQANYCVAFEMNVP